MGSSLRPSSIAGPRATGVTFTTAQATEGPATARCLIVVTPDAQRTMNTYLGACTRLGPADIDVKQVAAAQVTYVEGYLWDPPEAKKAVLKAFDAAHAAGFKALVLTVDQPAPGWSPRCSNVDSSSKWSSMEGMPQGGPNH